jgi:hypothetical protein
LQSSHALSRLLFCMTRSCGARTASTE